MPVLFGLCVTGFTITIHLEYYLGILLHSRVAVGFTGVTFGAVERQFSTETIVGGLCPKASWPMGNLSHQSQPSPQLSEYSRICLSFNPKSI